MYICIYITSKLHVRKWKINDHNNTFIDHLHFLCFKKAPFSFGCIEPNL